MPNILIALFVAAHGFVHPILAYHESRDEQKIVGGLWTHSWLLGDGPFAKRILSIGCFVTFALTVLAGLSLMGWIVPQDWWHTLMIAAAGASLLVLIVFWFSEFFIGVIIDLGLLALVLLANWNPIIG